MNANTNEDTLNTMEMDDLLDMTLDDLADMPEFKPFPIGGYILALEFSEKKINDIDSVELKLTVVEIAELNNPEDVPPKAGDSTNVLFMLKKKDDNGKLVKNELGQGQLKEILKVLAPAFPDAKTPREIMNAAKGFNVMGITNIRENKKDKNNIKYYTELKTIALI